MLDKEEIERLKDELGHRKEEGVKALKHLGKKALGRPICRNLFGIPAYTDRDWQMKLLRQGLDDHAEVMGITCWEVLVNFALNEILGKEIETRVAVENAYDPSRGVKDMFWDMFNRFDDKDEDSLRPMVEAAVNIFDVHDVVIKKYAAEGLYECWELCEQFDDIETRAFPERTIMSWEAVTYAETKDNFLRNVEAGRSHTLFPVAYEAFALWDKVKKPSLYYKLFANLMAMAEPWHETARDRILFRDTCDMGWKAHKELVEKQ